MHDVLYPALRARKGKPTENPGRHRALSGAELIDDVIMVDQSRIGRTTRSNPASYVGAFDAIRDLFARLPQARERKYTPARSASMPATAAARHAAATASNTSKCNSSRMCICAAPIATAGAIVRKCSKCKLARGAAPPKSIADVLDLTVSEALAFFAADTEVCLRLAPLADVGLEYLRLGQPVPTLSGGEAQRLKLAGHLAGQCRARNSAARPRRAAPPAMARARARCSCSMNRPPACISTTWPSCCAPSAG